MYVCLFAHMCVCVCVHVCMCVHAYMRVCLCVCMCVCVVLCMISSLYVEKEKIGLSLFFTWISLKISCYVLSK